MVRRARRRPTPGCLPLWLCLACASGAGPVAAAPAARGEVGVGYDLTNQIYFEQTFDSTAFSSRTTVSDPVARLQGLAAGTLEWRETLGSRLRLDGRVSAGEQLFQTQAYLDGRKALSSTWRAVVTGDVNYRDDRSFGTTLRDFRTAARLGAERRTEDLSSSGRALYLFDLSNGRNEDGTDYYPDYQFHRVALGYDHFGWNGWEWGTVLSSGYRSFPDTSARNYRDHMLEGRLRAGVGARGTWEALASIERRQASEMSAVGDRFWAGELDARGHVEFDARGWSVEGRGAFQGSDYDEPSPTFFHHAVWQAELGLRYERLPGRLVRPRAAAEFLRVPEGGGLGDPSTSAEARSAVTEEYDQWAGRLDVDLLGESAWFALNGGFGRRVYRNRARDEADLLARSSYWLAEVGGFSEFRLRPFLRLRVSGDVHAELHDVVSDDLTSLYVATELHYLFRP